MPGSVKQVPGLARSFGHARTQAGEGAGDEAGARQAMAWRTPFECGDASLEGRTRRALVYRRIPRLSSLII